MKLRTPIAGIALLIGVLGLAWWAGRLPASPELQGPASSSVVAPGRVAPTAVEPRPAVPPAAWGPSPFGDGPVVVAPQSSTSRAPAPNPFAARVVRFEKLRARAVTQPGRRAELAHLARSMQAELPGQVVAGGVSAAEALLLTGALLEILEPDAQLRAAEMAQFAVQFLPPADDEAG